MRPLVSVVIEGYNEEATALAALPDTMGALGEQDFPLEQVELVLLGSRQQTEHWKTLIPAAHHFLRIEMIAVNPEDCHYWRLKNIGATFAKGEIVAHVDSDAHPGPQWLASLVKGIQSGAGVSVGPSLYRTKRQTCDSPWMLAAALPSWSLMIARTASCEAPRARCLMGHNVAMRREVSRQHSFPTAKRSYSSVLLFFELVRSGVNIAFEPEQKVAHSMSLRWWLGRRHFRTGWETYIARGTDPDWPRIPALERIPLLEPIVLRMGLVFRDALDWSRFSRVVGVSPTRSVLLFPLALVASFAARAAEMVGMYAALFAPRATEQRARF